MWRERRHGPIQPCGIVTVVIDVETGRASVAACEHVAPDVAAEALADLAAKVNADRLAREAGGC